MAGYPHKILGLGGKPINYKNPPKPTDLVLWSKKTQGGKQIKGSFRTIAAFDRLNRRSIKKYGKEIVILQASYNSTVALSAGTHDEDACMDWYTPGVSWWEQQRFARALGFGCWYRHPPKFGNHIHGFPVPPKSGTERKDDFADNGFEVGIYVPGQLDDYYRQAFGLAGQHKTNSDPSWHPGDQPGGVGATIFNLKAYVATRLKYSATNG